MRFGLRIQALNSGELLRDKRVEHSFPWHELGNRTLRVAAEIPGWLSRVALDVEPCRR